MLAVVADQAVILGLRVNARDALNRTLLVFQASNDVPHASGRAECLHCVASRGKVKDCRLAMRTAGESGDVADIRDRRMENAFLPLKLRYQV